MPRHPPYALLHLITYYNPNLMRSIFFNKIFYDIFRQKDITSHYPVFKELTEREHSFKTKQNIIRSTISFPNLMRYEIFLVKILSSFIISNKTSHYPVFKELFLERFHSLKTKQNLLVAVCFVTLKVTID